MKFFTLLLCVAFVTGLTAVNGKNSNHSEQHPKASGSLPQVKPTHAPMTASSVAPTKAPKVSSASTKTSTVKVGSKSNNATKKNTPKAATSISSEKKVETKPTEKTPMPAPKDVEVKPIATPAALTTEKTLENTKVSYPIKAKEEKPLAVTAFITQNGSIYEIEDKDGIGKIEGRQNTEDIREHVCNYGSVVVYSDIPCDAVTNVKMSQMTETPPVGQTSNGENKEEAPQPDSNSLNVNQTMDKEKEYQKDGRPVRTRPNSKKPRRKNKNKLRKPQNNRRYSTRRVASRPNRQQSQNQRRYQQKKRRQQEKRLQENTRRQQVNHRRRVKTRPSYYDDYEDEEYAYSRGRDY